MNRDPERRKLDRRLITAHYQSQADMAALQSQHVAMSSALEVCTRRLESAVRAVRLAEGLLAEIDAESGMEVHKALALLRFILEST